MKWGEEKWNGGQGKRSGREGKKKDGWALHPFVRIIAGARL